MKPGDLSLHLEAYLALKKALGFSLGARERLLRDFVAFAQSSGVRGTIYAQVAFEWMAGDVLLYGFLVLPDGLLNFLFGGCFLS